MQNTRANSASDSPDAALTQSNRRPPSLARVSTVDALVAALRQRILDGEFAPRSALREVELASEYEVARHSVRAALQSLAQSGLLSHVPNRGMFVPEMTPADIADIFRLRAAVEIEVVTELAERGRVTQAMEEALAKLINLPADARWSTVIQTDLDFHRSLVQATGSDRLDAVYAGLQQEVQLCLTTLRGSWQPVELITPHSVILDVIRQRDPIRVASEMRTHMESSQRQLQELAATAAAANPDVDRSAAAVDPIPDRR
jgi:DNA-binding GntR family transcriptional regulator